jgi:hypothetical protein
MPDEAARTEEEQKRLDRRMIELLNELRVALPGVQVLFGFLLIVPFSQGFAHVTAFQRDVYFAALMSAAVATALLIAPSAMHRILFQHREKEHIIGTGTKQLIAGLAFLALSMVTTILLIADVLFGTAMVVGATLFTIVVFGGLWGVLPLKRLAAEDDRE